MINPICLLTLLTMVVLMLVPSCSPMVIEGKRIDSEKIKQLTLGQTPASQVEELFGKPTRIEKAEPAVEIYIYTYSAIQPYFWTIDKVGKEKFEVGMQKGVLKYYKLVREEEETVLKE
jgi:hypothetical protein